MHEKKEYRNKVRSRQMIRTAFRELIHEKPLEKITATDIINRSGLNRSTFYAHYPDVKGIMDEFTDEIVATFRQMLTEMDFSKFLQNPEPNLKKIMGFLEENQELYRILMQSELALVRLNQIKKLLIQQVMDTPKFSFEVQAPLTAQIHIHVLMRGIIDTYWEWLAGEIPCSLDELTGELAGAISLWLK